MSQSLIEQIEKAIEKETLKRKWHIHFLNRLSIYWDPYLTTVTTEYWTGHNRKRVIRLGDLTVWVKQ